MRLDEQEGKLVPVSGARRTRTIALHYSCPLRMTRTRALPCTSKVSRSLLPSTSHSTSRSRVEMSGLAGAASGPS